MLRSDETAQSPSQTLKKYASPAKEKYSCLPAAKSLEDSAPPNRLPSLQMPAIFWTMPRRRMTIRFNRRFHPVSFRFRHRAVPPCSALFFLRAMRVKNIRIFIFQSVSHCFFIRTLPGMLGCRNQRLSWPFPPKMRSDVASAASLHFHSVHHFFEPFAAFNQHSSRMIHRFPRIAKR